MFCSVHKWFISGSLDTGKPLSAMVRRHVDHCASCKAFAAGAQLLGDRLAVQGRQLSMQPHRELEERICAQLPHLTARSSVESRPRFNRSPSFWLLGGTFGRPLLAAAVTLIVIALGVWLAVPGARPTTETTAIVENIATADLQNATQPDLKIIGQKVGNLTASIESPLLNELAGLRAAADSMKTFFTNYVELKENMNENNNGS